MNADDSRHRYNDSWPGDVSQLRSGHGSDSSWFLAKGVLRFALWATALGGFGIYFFLDDIHALNWARTTRRTSIQLLSSARTTNDLEEAVHYLGAFITPTNGGWLAIRYRDTHGGRIQSIAIVRDSDGRWFESKHHWCGTIEGVAKNVRDGMSVEASIKSIEKELADPIVTYREPRVEHLKLLHIFGASDLTEARQSLVVAGFREFTP